MNKETWTKLAPEDQAIWDTLSDQTKHTILSYAQNRTPRAANTHEQSSGSTATDDTDEPPSNPESSDDSPQLEANVSEAIKSAHPGDSRRMLSSNTGKSGKREVSMVHWGDLPSWDHDGCPTPTVPDHPLDSDTFSGGNFSTPSVSHELDHELDHDPLALTKRLMNDETVRASMVDNYWNDYQGSDSSDEDQDFYAGGW
jgi:hypothetical protein